MRARSVLATVTAAGALVVALAACTHDFGAFEEGGDDGGSSGSSGGGDGGSRDGSSGGSDASRDATTGDAGDGSSCTALPKSCDDALTQCRATCAATYDTCVAKPGCNPGCKNKCVDDRTMCLGACSTTCISCAGSCPTAVCTM